VKSLPKLKLRLKINGTDSYNLTEDELFSIIIYTYDLGIDETSKNFFYIFNETFRKRRTPIIKVKILF
jgi:hypothetical protein